MSEARQIPDPILPYEDLIRTVQTAVEGVEDLYGALSNPLARHHLKREGIKDSLAYLGASHEELRRERDRLQAELDSILQGSNVEIQFSALEPAPQDSEVEAPTPLPLDFVNERVAGLLRSAGYYTIESVDIASDEELLAIDGIGPSYLEDIKTALVERSE